MARTAALLCGLACDAAALPPCARACDAWHAACEDAAFALGDGGVLEPCAFGAGGANEVRTRARVCV